MAISGGGSGSSSFVKGQEVRPLVNVDNYAKVYSNNSSSMNNSSSNSNGGGGGGTEPQPYHTRYDSKPFSYIR
jgi:hypothetical protein